ncbi:putative receptor-like protein kinase At4g00960 [Camellia sinensis]|uniref:putative receptor-like protein kinase At4g00960 n=1 Tax=Camellia sinensis TaxID=4442 RepID=UPI001036090B|nr:putative receptor-like protein kinase At4g00960 [Camellia sinensis]
MLGIQIVRDRKAKKLWLSQEKYVERVIAKFNMKDSKPVDTPLANHFKLSKSSCPSSTKEKEKRMEAIPYLSPVESLMGSCALAVQVTELCCFIHKRGRIIYRSGSWERDVVVTAVSPIVGIKTRKFMAVIRTDQDPYSKNPADILTKVVSRNNSKSAETLPGWTSNEKSAPYGRGGEELLGKLTDGGEIAVKKPLVISEKGKELVLNEMKLLLGSAHHRNIEFASNGSLQLISNFCTIFDGLDSEACRADALDWKRTYAIIIGVARGLLYLHERSHNVIIHCDIKPTNILIDENWVPKIADFGMANLFPQDQTHVNINEATVSGYLAPEYMDNGHVSPKADTYSFGVVVLELINSRKNWNSHNQSPNGQGLWDTANELCKEVKVSEFMDLKLIPSAVLDQVQLCVKIGVLCIEFDLELRPTMDRAYSMLLENHSSSNTLVNEPMRDGSSSSSSTA